MSARKRLADERRRHKQRNLIYIAITAVVVVAGVLAVALSRPSSTTAATTPQVRPVTTTGATLSAFATSSSDPAIGKPIPDVTGSSFDGIPVSITNDGKPKVVLFVAHWCPHCQREVPLLAADLHRTPLPPNIEMITISTGVNSAAPNYPPSKWLAGVNWPTPVIADDSQSSAATAYGLTGYPYLVFVDAQNHVQFRASGEMPVTEFRQHVAALQS